MPDVELTPKDNLRQILRLSRLLGDQNIEGYALASKCVCTHVYAHALHICAVYTPTYVCVFIQRGREVLNCCLIMIFIFFPTEKE